MILKMRTDGQMKNNGSQNTEHKTLHRTTHIPLKTGSKLLSSRRVRNLCTVVIPSLMLRNNIQIFVF